MQTCPRCQFEREERVIFCPECTRRDTTPDGPRRLTMAESLSGLFALFVVAAIVYGVIGLAALPFVNLNDPQPAASAVFAYVRGFIALASGFFARQWVLERARAK